MGTISTFGLKNIKLVETYHNTYRHYELQYAILHPFIKQYIAISNTCGKEMKHRFKTKDKDMTIIPNGIDRESIRMLSGIEGKKEHDGIVLMTVGRMSYEKNIKTPVKALAKLCSDKIKYCVIGDGPQRDDIMMIAKDNSAIEFTGQLAREQTIKKLAEADIVIMPSLWEGRSILQLEAMALDRPLILSDVPALREVFNEAELQGKEVFRKCNWGYLVKTNDELSYQQAVENFIKLDGQEKKAMSESVRLASLKNDISNVALMYKKVYEKVLKS